MRCNARCLSVLLSMLFVTMGTSVLAGKFNRQVSVGDAAPIWKELPGVDGKKRSLADLKGEVVVIIFFANHCPVAAACEERLKRLAKDYRPRGVDFVAISVSSLESDRMEKMKDRAADSKLPFPYLKDDSQQTGLQYGATVTPQVFVLNSDRKIAYMGAVDDHWRDATKVETHYLRDAVSALLDKSPVEIRETKPTGCGIEYKQKS